jgi:hypothetical protein
MPDPTLTPAAFAAKWRGVTTTEKAAAQEYFIDLCRLLGEPTPHEADPTGAQYAFEKRVATAAGPAGFADVWKRDFFAWEYKGKKKDLKAAYVQLLNYKDDLGNPPLLVTSDLERIEIRTNFTGLSPVLTTITLDDLAADTAVGIPTGNWAPGHRHHCGARGDDRFGYPPLRCPSPSSSASPS